MGKRKGRDSCQQAMAAARKRARITLPSHFECPFCNMHKTVVCTLKPEQSRANVRCEQCKMSYNTTCKVLTEPVDVYHEWLDACEEALQEPLARALHLKPGGLEEQPGGICARPRARAAAEHADMMARIGGGATADPAGELTLTLPPAPQRPRRGAQLHPGALLPRNPTLPELPQSPRSPRTVAVTGRQRVQLMEGLEHTTTAGLHTGAALHSPAAASLLAERTGMWGAAASGALPGGSSHLQQLPRRQHHQDPKQQLHEEGGYIGGAAAATATAGGSSWVAALSPPLRLGSDNGGGGIRSAASRKQREELRQQQAVRAFGSFEDMVD